MLGVSIACLYSSLMPYAIVMSGKSATTTLAAKFMRSSALRSFGFSKPYLAHILSETQGRVRPWSKKVERGEREHVFGYFVKARPSIRTTIQVFDKRESACSKARTYSNLCKDGVL